MQVHINYADAPLLVFNTNYTGNTSLLTLRDLKSIQALLHIAVCTPGHTDQQTKLTVRIGRSKGTAVRVLAI
jgi:hypothetical protein